VTGTGQPTIYTTPLDRDFYLCSVSLSISKIVTDSNSVTVLRATPFNDGQQDIIAISGTTLTADQQSINQVFTRPILLTRGTTIVLSKTASNGTSYATITGYLDD
jgi:PKD repeat protein